MNTIRLIIALNLAVLSVITTPAARSASFSIAFYEETGDLNLNGHNFFDDYTFAGGGTFEINDSAVSPNNSVLFSDSAFVSFEASFTGLSTASSGDITTFTLGADDFEEGTTRERQLIFDASAIPLRFDRASTTFSNARAMCDPTPTSCQDAIGSRAAVSLVDDDSFETIYLEDGTVTTISNNTSGAPFTPFAGAWTYQKGTALGGSGLLLNGFYTITPVPIPAAIWLFGSGLLGLIGISRRKKSA